MFVLVVFVVITAIFYKKLRGQIGQLEKDIAQLQNELQQQKDRSNAFKPEQLEPSIPSQFKPQELSQSIDSSTSTTRHSSPPPLPKHFTNEALSADTSRKIYTFYANAADFSLQPLSYSERLPMAAENTIYQHPIAEANRQTSDIFFVPSSSNKKVKSTKAIDTSTIEPDEQSLPVVTSLFHSIKNWFFGGNLVVRVGVLVLLVGVVLLLRLLSEYIETPIEIKLMAIGVAGLGLAGLGLKLVKNRFAYGITLQGAGLAIAYLTTFFAYSVYQVIPSLPSFIGLGVLSAVTIGLAVRQNAFPLALLALSGGFFAPLLTSTDTGSLTALFSYYLLLNVTIAIIAHYRTWKVLNLLGVMVTFSLAYTLGASEDFSTVISQRWSLVLLVALHLALYLFVVIRYAQQIIAYNLVNEKTALNLTSNLTNDLSNDLNNNQTNSQASNQAKQNATATSKPASSLYLFPIDTGLLFSVPVLAFGLFAVLLNDIEHALTITSTILAAVYLGLGWVLAQRSQRYALMTEGMLALGFGFFAVTTLLALDTKWVAAGWSIQGLVLVWFGRRSLRAWTVLFGLLLQLIVGTVLVISELVLFIDYYPLLTLTISAISSLAIVFILRDNNSPIAISQQANQELLQADNVTQSAKSLGISNQAAKQWLTGINSNSIAFNLVWKNPMLISLLTFAAGIWALYTIAISFDKWLGNWQLATTTLIAMASLTSLVLYWFIDRYYSWVEARHFSYGLLSVFYISLILQLPQKFEFNHQWLSLNWLIFASLVVGWAVMGQLWLKRRYGHFNNSSDSSFDNNVNSSVNKNRNNSAKLSIFDSASWLATGVLVLTAAVHYGLPDSDGVITVLIPVVLMLAGLWFSDRYYAKKQNSQFNHSLNNSGNINPRPLYWFNWHDALISCAWVFVPITLAWVVITNWYYDGVVWGLPYFPLINLYDVALWLVLLYGLGLFYVNQQTDKNKNVSVVGHKIDRHFSSKPLFIILGLISFWVISSVLVRTLHAFIGTPLWAWDAWSSEQVQTGLTILWTLIALIATIVASRQLQRMLWFMGIGLLGVVVLKLVLVDLSQTGAIWRVVSFLVAGSLILLIGYLAPLPPERIEQINKTKK